MSAEQSKSFNLTVQTGDEAAEIFIIDSQFQRVANGIGEKAEFKVRAGLYTVKIRVGSEYQEKSVALLSGDEVVSFEPIQFSTAAPLTGTSKTHGFQIDNAVAQSTQVHIHLGEGSQVYLFARNWTEKDRSTADLPLHKDPAAGLTLRNSKDEILVDYGSPEVGVYSYDWEPWSACNVQLDPGVYCLCLVTGSGQILKQSIVASPDWQTQIFLLQRNYDYKGKDIHADLSNGSLFMSRIGHGFQPARTYKYSENPDFHLTEMARQALINNRPVLGREIASRMTDPQFDNPMLGIYAAHLLLLDEKSDKSILPAVINNLRGLLVHPHPDVEAIAQKLNLPVSYIFDMPPMLHISWSYVIEASVTHPDLVPENSFASKIAGHAWGGNPWLLWGQYAKQNDNTNILFEQLKRLTKLEAASVDTSKLAPDQLMSTKMALPTDPETKDVESLPQPAGPVIPSNTPASRQMGNEQILHLVQALGIPRLKLEALIKRITGD